MVSFGVRRGDDDLKPVYIITMFQSCAIFAELPTSDEAILKVPPFEDLHDMTLEEMPTTEPKLEYFSSSGMSNRGCFRMYYLLLFLGVMILVYLLQVRKIKKLFL